MDSDDDEYEAESVGADTEAESANPTGGFSDYVGADNVIEEYWINFVEDVETGVEGSDGTVKPVATNDTETIDTKVVSDGKVDPVATNDTEDGIFCL